MRPTVAGEVELGAELLADALNGGDRLDQEDDVGRALQVVGANAVEEFLQQVAHVQAVEGRVFESGDEFPGVGPESLILGF